MEFERFSPKYLDLLHDESGQTGQADLVYFPTDADNMADAICQATDERLPFTVQGARTGVTGGAVPQGGLIVNLSRMNTIHGFSSDGCLRVQAGVTLARVDDYLRRHTPDQFFPPNPSETTATLGGVWATNAHGTNRLRYGETTRYIRVIGGVPLADGRTLATDFALSLLPCPRELWGVVFFLLADAPLLPPSPSLTAAAYFDQETLALLREGAATLPALSTLPAIPDNAIRALYWELSGDDSDTLEAELTAALDSFLASGGQEEHTWAALGEHQVTRFRALCHGVPELLGQRGGYDALRAWIDREDVY